MSCRRVVAARNGAAAQRKLPSRPVSIIVPTTAGGPPDTIARIITSA